MSAIISIKIREKKYPKKQISLLKDFSLEVWPGESVAIVGSSGVGKTTLLNILGLLDRQYEGEYHLFGKDIGDTSEEKQAQWRNKDLGFVLQDSALIDSLTIEDNIKLPFIYAKDQSIETEANRLHYVSSSLGIESILKHKPHECSGGQKSRAVFARAVIMEPSILLSDEPTSSLDQENKDQLLNFLFEMNEQFNTTLITVTHDAEAVNRHDRVITIEGDD